MEIVENEGNGTTVVLVAGDDLGAVGKPHSRLITASVREAFANPRRYFEEIANRCNFRQMSNWIRALVAAGTWELHLNQGFVQDWTLVGFDWEAAGIRGATIGLPNQSDLGAYPKDLQTYYSLVDVVHWNGFGCAGGLEGASTHTPLADLGYKYHGDTLEPNSAFVWGSSPCGDMLIYTSDGSGGWLCHENGHIRLLGTIAETIDWIFSELSSDRGPEYRHGWNK